MLKSAVRILLVVVAIGLYSCKKTEKKKPEVKAVIEQKTKTPVSTLHNDLMKEIEAIQSRKNSESEKMILIKGGEFLMGASTNQGRSDELPVHKENVGSFYMDQTEVTNAQFKAFVDATAYVTIAERPIDINHIVAVTGADPSTLDSSPSALVFNGNPQMWWEIKKGANWKQPKGPGSSIEGKDNHPVVQVSWYDAMAYCKWAGKRLPTEEEFEYAARSGGKKVKYNWGDDYSEATKYANFHQGTFPNNNLKEDKFESSSPVKSFKPNAIGLYDIGGNVWEWTLNSYHKDGYQRKINGEKLLYEKDTSIHQLKVIRGGSYLCNESYCTGYRVAARMHSSPDTALEHTGFRCVKSVNL